MTETRPERAPSHAGGRRRLASKPVAARPSRVRRVYAKLRAHPVECLLFVLLFATYAYFAPDSQHNSGARFAQMRTIWEDHTLDVSKWGFMSGDLISYRVGDRNIIYPNKAPGTTLLGLLPFGVFSWLLRGLVTDESLRWPLVAYLTRLFTIGLLSVVAAVFTYRVCHRVVGSAAWALAGVVAVWLGSITFPYSVIYMSHQHAAAQVAIAFALLFEVRHGGARASPSRLVAVGLLLGLTLASEYPAALLVGPVLLYGLWTAWNAARPGAARPVALGTLLLWTALGTSVLLIYNLAAYGEMLHIPYEDYAEGPARAASEHRLGFMGVHWPGWERFLEVLANITVRPKRGLLYIAVEGFRIYACSPVLWLALPGFILLFRQRLFRVEAVLLMLMTAAYLTFNACYGTTILFWGGGLSLGPRHLVPLLPLLAVPVCLSARKLPWLFFPLLTVSIFYMLVGTAVEPRVPYIFENPPRDMYIPRYLEGWFGHGRAGLFVVEDVRTGKDTAFNLAELAGIPDRWQLVPLLAAWFWLGQRLIRQVWPRPTAANPPRRPAKKNAPHHSRPSVERPPLPRTWATAALGVFTAVVAFTPVVYGWAFQEAGGSAGLRGRYFDNNAWLGNPARVRIDDEIDFDWSKNPPLLPPFSVEWTGRIRIAEAGRYRFRIESSDAVTVQVSGRTIIMTGASGAVANTYGNALLPTGEHPIRIGYVHPSHLGSSIVHFYWTPPSGTEEIVPAEVLLPDVKG